MSNASWQVFALGSAFFAALTAVFGKIGVSRLNSDLATFIRTIVILIVTAVIVSARREWQTPQNFSYESVIFWFYLELPQAFLGFATIAHFSLARLLASLLSIRQVS
jgi:bacterial/archaeal transporter family protein